MQKHAEQTRLLELNEEIVKKVIPNFDKEKLNVNSIYKTQKEENTKLIEDLSSWMEHIDSNLFISTLSAEDQKVGWSIHSLLERAIDQWKLQRQ